MKRGMGFAVAAALALSGCGLRGDPERPPPLFGDARERYEAEQAQRKAAEEAKRQSERQRMEIPVPAPPATPPSPASPPTP